MDEAVLLDEYVDLCDCPYGRAMIYREYVIGPRRIEETECAGCNRVDTRDLQVRLLPEQTRGKQVLIDG